MNNSSNVSPSSFLNKQTLRLIGKQNLDKNRILRRALWLLLVFISKSTVAQLEVYGKFNRNGLIEPIINYNGSKALNDKLSVTFFALVRKSWSQALIGLAYSPSEVITFSSGLGMEHGKSSPRYSASVFVKKNKNTLLVLGEWGSGNDNYLYKVNLFHQFTEQIIFGATAWRYHGVGPNFRLLFQTLQTTLWLMPAYDIEAKQVRTMVGISYKM